MNTGSSLDTQTSAKELGRLDTLTTRQNAERRAREFDIAAANQGYQANLYGAQAKTSSQASYLSAAGSILGGLSSVSGKWMQMDRAGIWGKSNLADA